MDTLTPEARSAHMRLIKSRDTSPELSLRKLVRSLGYRYRKNHRAMAGSPDISLVKRKRAIFLHGCFWHRHDCPAGRRSPKSRVDYWSEKFTRNVERDRTVAKELRAAGWRALIVWECELKNRWGVEKRIRKFLGA
jgi:DNA mismatch endonuclease (patch repair protein)